MATRRFNGSLQHAKLYQGNTTVLLRDPQDRIDFPIYDLPSTRSKALRWFVHATDFTPFLNLDWEAWPGDPYYYYGDDDDDDDAGAHDEHTSNPSTLKAHFMWGIHRDMMAFTSHYDEERAMSLADVRSMLEHYLDWA